MQPSPAESDFSPAQTVGNFRLLQQLGEGGTSIVFLAERIDFAQRVAIKILREDPLPSPHPAKTANEADILAALDHPHIVRLIDHATAPNVPSYLVMEFVDGIPLDQYCDTHRLTLPDRINLLLQVLDAIEHAHRRLVVHGDLKPANILVSPEANAKLLDFGAFSGAHTPDFASPEQRIGDPLTLATDIYSAGLIARLTLAGISPSAPPDELASITLGNLPTAQANIIAEARATTASKLIATVRGDLDAILKKALRTNPNERFASAEQFAADLRSYIAGRPVSARRTNRIDRTRKWVYRHKILAAITIWLASVIVFMTIGVAWQSAKAAHERRIAQNRLHDLVRLTGTLDGELYDSLKTVPQAGPARSSLLAGATDTLDSLSKTDSDDPILALELGNQYEKLARLQLQQASPSSTDQASRDLTHGIAALRSIPESSSSYNAAQQHLHTMTALQQTLHP